MSKNIVIGEGGTAKQLTVDKLETNLVGGGTCLWVPEDGTILGTKNITENGTYKASDDGYYGFSQVTVNGQGIVSGKDADGDDAYAYVDPNTGLVTTSKIPSSIEVITPPIYPPSNPYDAYFDGQAILKIGMVVKAYYNSGAEYGTVPNSEITFEPEYADESKVTGERITEFSEFGEGPWPQRIDSSASMVDYVYGQYVAPDGQEYDVSHHFECDGGYIALLVDGTGYRLRTIYCAPRRTTAVFINQFGSPWPQRTNYNVDREFTYDGKTVYYKGGSSGENTFGDGPTNEVVDGDEISTGEAAWIVVYGNIIHDSGLQKIKVLWPRIGDKKVLESSFGINVLPNG